jgi:hypothetical protein
MSRLPKHRIAAPQTKWNVRNWKRAELKQDVRIYVEEREREEEEKVATLEAHEHAKARDAQEHEEILNYMRKIMYENKTELDRMKHTVQELQQENKRLLKENESLSKSITTKSTSSHQYNATRTPDFKTISRKALIRGYGTKATAMHKGNIQMITRIGQATRHINVEDVEYVPGFKKNLLSYVHLEKRENDYHMKIINAT